MKEYGPSIFALLCILTVFGLGVSCEVYKFKDCKKVGHSTTYCIIRGCGQ